MSELMIGILTGLATSIVAWLLTQTLLQPRIRFSEGVSKKDSPHSPCGYRYRVKLQNVGVFRSALDLQARAVISVQGLDPEKSLSWTSFRLEMSTAERPRVRPGGNMAWAIDPASLPPGAKLQLKDLGFHEVADNDARSLEDLLLLRGAERDSRGRSIEPAHLRVQVLVNDGWTGKQFYKASQAYTDVNVKERAFRIGTTNRWRRYGERVRGVYRALEFAETT